MTKVSYNGRFSLLETLKFLLSFGKERPAIKGTTLKTLKGKPRKSYVISRDTYRW